MAFDRPPAERHRIDDRENPVSGRFPEEIRQHRASTASPTPRSSAEKESKRLTPVIILVLVLILRTPLSEQVRQDQTTNSTPPQHASRHQRFDDATLLAGCLVIFVVIALVVIAETLAHQMQQDGPTHTTPP